MLKSSKPFLIVVLVLIFIAASCARSASNTTTAVTAATDDLQMKVKCKEIADQLDAKAKEEISGADYNNNIVQMKSEYRFNKQLNTCLYASGELFFGNSANGNLRHESIIDSLTNKELASYTAYDKDPNYIQVQKEFDSRKLNLFSE